MLSTRGVFALAAVFALALTTTARANDDVLSLNLPASTEDSLTLKLAPADDDADTQAAIWRHGGYGYGYRGGYGYGGGYRGGYGYGGAVAFRGGYGYGSRGGYIYGGAVAYRGGYGYGGGYGYRGGYGYGGYGRAYGSFYGSAYGPRGGYANIYGRGYRGYGYGAGSVHGSYYGPNGGYARFGAYGSYGGYRGGYATPYYMSDEEGDADTVLICSRKVVTQQTAPTVYVYPQTQAQPQSELRYYAPQQQQAPQVMPRVDPNATYDYDGGPREPVPMPRADSAPTDKPAVVPYHKAFPAETLVSVSTKDEAKEEKKSGKWNFPAYGEQPTRSQK